MGFFQRFIGGDSPEKPPPSLPGFNYELMSFRGKDAVKKALELREEWRGSATPVIIGTNLTNVSDHGDVLAPEECLESAGRVDLEKWFRDHSPETEEDPEVLESITNPSDWNISSGSGMDFSLVPEGRRVLLAKIPTAQPYEVPAYLKLGGWNACPEGPVHVALWKKWQEQYGAEILCVSGDVIEATVSRPPLEKDACYQLAREQYVYCNDIVDQGVESIDALASILRAGKSWYFWWD